MKNDVHILPSNDLKVHAENRTCHCQPTIESQSNGEALVIHNAYDGREFDEIADAIEEGN